MEAGQHGQTCEVEVFGEAPAVEHSTRNDTSPIVFGKAVSTIATRATQLMEGLVVRVTGSLHAWLTAPSPEN